MRIGEDAKAPYRVVSFDGANVGDRDVEHSITSKGFKGRDRDGEDGTGAPVGDKGNIRGVDRQRDDRALHARYRHGQHTHGARVVHLELAIEWQQVGTSQSTHQFCSIELRPATHRESDSFGSSE